MESVTDDAGADGRLVKVEHALRGGHDKFRTLAGIHFDRIKEA